MKEKKGKDVLELHGVYVCVFLISFFLMGDILAFHKRWTREAL
jgi:hypothetical protein